MMKKMEKNENYGIENQSSPNQDIFIFDKELTSNELSFNIDIVNTRDNVDGYIANGEYFILPARYYRESSFMDNGEVLVVDNYDIVRKKYLNLQKLMKWDIVISVQNGINY